METPTFKTREELYTWLKENKEDIIYSKKSQFKKSHSNREGKKTNKPENTQQANPNNLISLEKASSSR